MSKRFISTRPGGFKITLSGKQHVFPMNETCDVPDVIAKQLVQFSEHVSPFQEKTHVKYEAATDEAPEGSETVENEESNVAIESDLASLGLTDATIEILAGVGLGTKAKVAEAIDAGRKLSEIQGIGAKTEERIIASLDI